MEKPSSSSSSTTYPNKATALWDCGSTLYDSFELNSFKRHLDSAIANSARSLSMPHLSDRHHPPVAPPPTAVSKKPFKISRSLHKFLRSVFKLNNHQHHQKHNNNNPYKSPSLNTSSTTSFDVAHKSRDRYVVVYDKSGPVLSAISELPEFEMAKVSPDMMGSMVQRSASERFRPTTTIGISCA